MNNSIIISANNLTKAYKIFDKPLDRLQFHLFGKDKSKDFYALENITFQVQRGETLGIIGKNGSGKSTLLQLLTGIIPATSGTMKINGQIAALLELGSGFNPESTGIENIYMNGAILGLNKKSIQQKLQDIISFADIGSFIHSPVKTYSSGMYVRLAFAVAINVDADIIVIDEALAVGDIFFRQKCYAKLNEMKNQGKTIILVTHGMGEVEQFCDRAILLSDGKILADGNSQEVVKQYYLLNQEGMIDCYAPQTGLKLEENLDHESDSANNNDLFFNEWSIKEPLFFDLTQTKEVSNGKATFVRVGIFDQSGYAKRVFEQGEQAYIYSEVEILDDIDVPIWGTTIYNQRNIIIHGKDTGQTDTQLPRKVKRGSILKLLHLIELNVAPDEYTIEVGFNSMKPSNYLSRGSLSHEELHQVIERIATRTHVGFFAVIVRRHGNPTKLMCHGVCDLNGKMDIHL